MAVTAITFWTHLLEVFPHRLILDPAEQPKDAISSQSALAEDEEHAMFIVKQGIVEREQLMTAAAEYYPVKGYKVHVQGCGGYLTRDGNMALRVTITPARAYAGEQVSVSVQP